MTFPRCWKICFRLQGGFTDFTAGTGQAHIQSFNQRKLSSISCGTLVNCQHFSLDTYEITFAVVVPTNDLNKAMKYVLIRRKF